MSDSDANFSSKPADRNSTDLEEADWEEVVDEMKTLPKGGATVEPPLDSAPEQPSTEQDDAAMALEVVSALAFDSIPEIVPEEEEEAPAPVHVVAPVPPPRPSVPPPSLPPQSVPPQSSPAPSAPRSAPFAPTLVIATMAAGRAGGSTAATAEQALVEELGHRADGLEKAGDALGASRARTELALVLEVAAGDRASALSQFVRAHVAAPTALAPILGARWLTPQRPVGPALTLALDHLRAVRDDASRAERCVEVARLHHAAGTVLQAKDHYRQALASHPSHPSALRGLEGLLQIGVRKGDNDSAEALASHLELMASSWANEPRLAAWLHVERAALLDRAGHPDVARAALLAALQKDGQSLFVRRAYARQLSQHREHEALVSAWAEEAGLEGDPKRAARLEYAAARLASERLDDARRAIALHERAAVREGADLETRRSAWRETARLYDLLGVPKRSAEAWQQLLPMIEQSAHRAYVHRRLSELFELIGQPAQAAAHGEHYLQYDPDDVEARDRIDRALESLGQHERRVSFWAADAARVSTPAQRADAFARAAAIAEHQVKNVVLAQSMYRAAWAADPSHVDAFDGLARLLAREVVDGPNAVPPEVRARIDLYEQAAVSTGDAERKIACLLKVAGIYEEELQLHGRALDVYRRILSIDPLRRAALLGVQRTAARCRDYGELVKALVAEAGLVSDTSLQRSLLLRASVVASESMGDPDRAVELIGRLLQRSPGDLVALRAAWRANYRNSRHEEALAQLKLLLKHSRRGTPSFSICVEMALLLEDRLHRHAEAVQSWREAHRQEPSHPVPPFEICRLLVASGQYRPAADELTQMAERASEPAMRARLFAQAAEILDDRLEDLEAALAALQQAHASAPDDDAIFDRLVRVMERREKPGELVSLLERRLARVGAEDRFRLLFQLAELLVGERDYVRAVTLLDELIVHDPDHAGAQRLLEQSLRRTENWPALASLLRAQAERASSPEVRTAALWEVLFLEEHREVLPGDETLGKIRSVNPSDPFVREAMVRASGLAATTVEQASSLAASLSVMSTASGDPSASAALDLAAALVIERTARDKGIPAPPEAMQRYRACLARWPECLAAARNLLRVAHSIGDQLATIEAHAALGRIESEPVVRAEHCAVAADMMVAAGTGDFAGAVALYASALEQDADQGRAVAGLVGLVQVGADAGRVADVLRTALEAASGQVQVAAIGGALASIARERLRDPNVAVEALRRVRSKAPGHVPTLIALAESCNDVHLAAEAADAAHAALAISQDPVERLRALLSLAEAHANHADHVEDARREATEAEVAAEPLDRAARLHVIERLERVYARIQDPIELERLTCMAVALSADDSAALGRLAHLFRPNEVDTAIGYVQALHRVVAMADLFGVPHRPLWYIEIGRLEAGILGRSREGLARLRHAIELEPARLESTIALADALAALGAHDEALVELRGALAKQPVGQLDTGAVVAMILAVGRGLQATGRTAQALVTEEILACFGYGAEDRIAVLRSRVPNDMPPAYGALERTVIERSVVPQVGHGVALRVALALDELIPKLLPPDPIAMRLSPAARLSARATHPLRVLADRFAQAYGGIAFDLYVDVPTLVTPRVLAGTPAAVLLPTGFDRLPPSEQVAGIARLLAFIALGIPWIDQLPPGELDGLLVGALHVGRPGWDAGGLPDAREQAASIWRPRIAKASSRKHRRALDELAEEASLDMDSEAWRAAVHTASWRCAWLVSSDWIATFNHVWRTDAELSRLWGAQVVGATFGYPVLRDLLFWALSTEATPLARVMLRS